MSLSTGFSPKPLGMILSLRRSLTNSGSSRLVVLAKRRCVTAGAGGRCRPRSRPQTGDRARKDLGVVGADARRQLARDRPRGRLIAGGEPRLELRDRSVGTLAARLRIRCARSAGAPSAKAFLRRGDPRRPSETISSGSPSPRVRRSWKNARTVSTSSLDPAINPKRTLRPSSPTPQAASTASRCGLAEAARRFRQRTGRRRRAPKDRVPESAVLGPQTLGDLAHRRPRQKPSTRLVGERILDVARRQTARVEFHRQPLESPVRPANAARTLEMNGSGVSRTCGAEFSTAPSAVFTLLSDTRCGSRAFRPRRVRSARGQRSLTSPSSASSTISRSARRTRSPRPAAVPKSPFIKARSSSRGRSGADSLCIRMLPGAPGGNRKPAFLLRFRQGASQPPFSSKAYAFTMRDQLTGARNLAFWQRDRKTIGARMK